MNNPLVGLRTESLAPLHKMEAVSTGKSVPWRLNQQLAATVVSNHAGDMHLKIDGKAYTPQSNIFLKPGHSLLLEVVSLSPYIELALVNPKGIPGKSLVSPSIVLSEQLLQKIPSARGESLSNLINFINSSNSADMRSLSVETVSLLKSLQKKLIRHTDLSNTGKLKSAFSNTGIHVEKSLSSDEAIDSAKDVKSILSQIFKSLGDRYVSRTGAQASGKIPESYGVAIYRNGIEDPFGFKALLTQKLESSFSRILANQQKSMDEQQHQNQRWHFGLPVAFFDKVQTIPITIYRNGKQKKGSKDSATWAVKFSFKMNRLGFIKIKIVLVDLAVSLSMECEKKATLALISHSSDSLYKSMRTYGLKLIEFNCTHLAKE
ncbi:MAG: hypothetical protein COA96_05030 [SAR86 cluster bacterium]|uniref:Flagellar hook-length control protein-like C-terminal domain-containing protein n=1 Tax=SAR86 cluster bacterium TaxID=2030880 RepID=A0A2A5B532_9GAMM|nr:MAG: hypothetical protein COA96_05030 [SAR86 cluster bacterium]